jgi:Flp pilus assembly protein TadD
MEREKKLDEAIRYFKRAVAISPRYSDALNDLGVAYEAKGEMDLAIASYRRAVAADPTNLMAKKNLARFK